MSHAFYDAHNHLQDEWFIPHLDVLLKDLPASGIAGMVVNGTSENDWELVAALADKADWIVPSYGLHPWDCGNRSPNWASLLRQFLERSPNAAVGEIGIDNWILERAKPDDSRLLGLRRAALEEQSEVFQTQLALASELGRAASIHCLDAWQPLFALLKKAPLPRKGFLLHAYGGPADMVPSFVDLGAHFSFNGSFLDPRRKRVLEAFRRIPASRLLIETDAPAMIPPVPWRCCELPLAGSATPINHPCNITGIYRGFSTTLGVSLESLVLQCRENFTKLFTPIRARQD